jgi:hypothetical protein
VRLGFEVRVEAVSDGQDVWAQVSRATADALDLAAGDTVYLTPMPHAKSLAVTPAT